MSKKKWYLIVLLLGIAGMALAVLLYLYPADQYDFWPKCILNYYTGYYCPGCGNTRALSALLHGDLPGSLKKNILFIPTVAAVVLTLVYPKIAYNRVFTWSLVIIYILFFILRNLPYYPFTLLAPH